MKCGIYKITNTINNKSYIGQSVDIVKRWRHHCAAAFNPMNPGYEYPLYRAFRKYGLDNFTFEILLECEKQNLDIQEEYYIELFKTLNNEYGYNQVQVQQGGIVLTPSIVNQIVQELQTNMIDNTETIGKKFGVSGRTVRAINSGESWYNKNLTYPIRNNYIGKQSQKGSSQNYCIKCGKPILSESTYCIKCGHLAQRKVERPSREELKLLIYNKPFTQIAKTYGVSDNTIRKWCKAYNLPTKKSDIQKFTIENWELV